MNHRLFRLALLITPLVLAAGCGRPSPADLHAAAEAGQDALRAGDWKGARTRLARAARGLPADGALQYDLGQAELRSGNLRAAARAFDSAATLLTGDDAVDALLALARVRADQRHWVEATDAVQRAQAIAGPAREADLLATLGGIEYRQGLGDAARQHLCAALLRNADHPLALYNLGCVYLYHYGDKPPAARAFSRYLLVAPADPDADTLLDRHLAALDGVQEGTSEGAAERIRMSRATTSPAEAFSLATLAVQEDPLSDETLVNYAERAQALGTAEATENARQIWHRFAHLYPASPLLAKAPATFRLRSPATALNKAAIALEGGNRAAAKTAYREALTSDPASFEALLGLANILGAEGDAAGALRAIEQANVLRPNRPDILLYLAGTCAADPARTADAVRYYRLYLQHARNADPSALAAIRDWLARAESDVATRP